MIKDKKALSELISYVLLIVIAIALSVSVYSWLKFNAVPSDREKCSEDAALSITNYLCNNDSKTLQISIENRGLFNLDGLFLSASNSTALLPTTMLEVDQENCIQNLGSNIGRCDFVSKLKSNDERTLTFSYSSTDLNNLGRIRIQPFILGKEEVMLCSNVVDIVLENCYENIIHEELLPTDIGQCNFTTENTLQLLIPSSSIRCNYGVPTDVTVSGTTLTWECLPIGEGEITDSCSANYLTQLIFYANFSDPLPPTFTVSEAVKSLTGGYSNTPAYIYDGVNDNIAVTGTGVSSLNGKRLLTVCAWVNLSTLGTSDTDDSAIFARGNLDASSILLWYDYSAPLGYTFNVGDPGLSNRVVAPNTAQANTWQHVCGVLDNKNRRIYVNGELKASISTAASEYAGIMPTEAYKLGSGAGIGLNFYLNGKIDEVRIYDSALSSVQIQAIYNYAPPL